MTHQILSEKVEALLVSQNPRRMAELRPALTPGYCQRSAAILQHARRVIIGTGFPVESTFETDGPLGAIALYNALEALDIECHIACADPLASALSQDYRVLQLNAFSAAEGRSEALANLAVVQPDVVVSIERPGLAADGHYYNMRGEDISSRCAVFDYYLALAACPSIAIGDGGNEIGMGKILEHVRALDIHPAATSCDELLVADVSNWGAYALVGLLEAMTRKPLLHLITHKATLQYLSERGSIDGVTRENTLTEDGLPAEAGLDLLAGIRGIIAEHQHTQEMPVT